MQDIRCTRCNKLLAKGRFYVLHIKCPRCGAINAFQRVENPEPACLRAPSEDKTHASR